MTATASIRSAALCPAAVAAILLKNGFKEKFYPDQGETAPFYNLTKPLCEMPALSVRVADEELDPSTSVHIEVTPGMQVQWVVGESDYVRVEPIAYVKGSKDLGAAGDMLKEAGLPEHELALLTMAVKGSKGVKMPTEGQLSASNFIVTKFDSPSGNIVGTAVLLRTGVRKTDQVVYYTALTGGKWDYKIVMPTGLTFAEVQRLAKDIELFESLMAYTFS